MKRRTRGPFKIEQVPHELRASIKGLARQHVADVWSGAACDLEVATANAEFLAMSEPLVEALRALIALADGSVSPFGRKAIADAKELLRKADALTNGTNS